MVASTQVNNDTSTQEWHTTHRPQKRVTDDATGLALQLLIDFSQEIGVNTKQFSHVGEYGLDVALRNMILSQLNKDGKDDEPW